MKCLLIALLMLMPIFGNAAEKKTKKVTTPPAVTFKGVKFGSSIDEFLKSFPDSNCKKVPLISHCKGGPLSFLGKDNAMYEASFWDSSIGNGFYKLKSVNVAFFGYKPITLAEEIKFEISRYFGVPEVTTNENVEDNLEHDIYIWREKEANITLSICNAKHSEYTSSGYEMFPFVFNPICPNSFVYVEFAGNKVTEESPASDF